MVGYIVPYMEPSISPFTLMDSTTVGRAPKTPAPLLWRRPKAASIMVDGEIDGSIYSALAIHSAVADNRLVCGSGLLVLLIQAYSGLIQCLFRLFQGLFSLIHRKRQIQN